MMTLEQEARLNPPLKRFWGSVSIGMIAFFLAFTFLFPSDKEPKKSKMSQIVQTPEALPFMAIPNRAVSPNEAPPTFKNSGTTITHFQVWGQEDRFIAKQPDMAQARIVLDPPFNALLKTRVNEDGLSEWEFHGDELILLKAIPLAIQSQDKQVMIQGQLSLWLSEDQLLWNFDASLVPGQSAGHWLGN